MWLRTLASGTAIWIAGTAGIRLAGQRSTLPILPTPILDPFSRAFFTSIFPNIDPGAEHTYPGMLDLYS
jgi:hypothetical protein